MYQTTDLYLSALIQTKLGNLTRMEPGDSGEFRFVFDNKDSCEQLAKEYFEGGVEVNAREFVARIKDLKDRLYSLKAQIPVDKRKSA